MSLKGTVSRVKAPRDNRNWTEKVSQTTHATTSQNFRAFPLPPDRPWVDGRGRAAFTHLGRRSRIPAAADTLHGDCRLPSVRSCFVLKFFQRFRVPQGKGRNILNRLDFMFERISIQMK